MPDVPSGPSLGDDIAAEIAAGGQSGNIRVPASMPDPASRPDLDAIREPDWFPPQHGDIALIERWSGEGYEPYNLIVCWHHSDQAWWNATGGAGPMPGQPALHEFRRLLVRDNTPVLLAELDEKNEVIGKCWMVQWSNEVQPHTQWAVDRYWPFVELFTAWGQALERLIELRDKGIPADFREIAVRAALAPTDTKEER